MIDSFDKYTYDFTLNKATLQSIANRRVAYGVGINDSTYITNPMVDGKMRRCPIYAKWWSMLTRCYSSSYHKDNPTYTVCEVDPSWFYFSKFREWVITQDWKGLELDKDLKIKGNLIYSADNCLFVSSNLNRLLGTNYRQRGKYPQGVSFDTYAGRFQAGIRYNGVKKGLGRFDSVAEANAAYQKARAEKITTLIEENTFPTITPYLRQHI